MIKDDDHLIRSKHYMKGMILHKLHVLIHSHLISDVVVGRITVRGQENVPSAQQGRATTEGAAADQVSLCAEDAGGPCCGYAAYWGSAYCGPADTNSTGE